MLPTTAAYATARPLHRSPASWSPPRGPTRRRLPLLAAPWVALILAGMIPAAQAEPPPAPMEDFRQALDAWAVSGSNTFRYDYYTVGGDRTSSPYSVLWSQVFDEVNLNATRRLSPYETWRAQFFGVLNDSPYRQTEMGVVPERANLLWEKGDAALPYRIEAGDLFAFFSLRTLQQSMKGIQVELQPAIAPTSLRHSLILVSGATQQPWRGLDPADDFTNGLSWLAEHPEWGRLGLNLVHNSRQARPESGALNRQQFVASLSGDKEWRHRLGQTLLEAEVAGFVGDHDDVSTATAGQDGEDVGVFTQVTGTGPGGLTYRTRYERYGREYRPRGAVITPARHAGEVHLGYRFLPGLDVRGRYQIFRDGLQTANPADSTILGLTVAGALLPWFVPDLSGNLDAFAQSVKNRDGSTNTDPHSVSLTLSKPILFGVVGRLAASWLEADNHVTTGTDTTTWQTAVNLDIPVNVMGIAGAVSPGMAYRKQDATTSGSTDLTPTLAANLAAGPHSLSASWSLQSQDRNPPGSVNVATIGTNVAYRFTWQSHTLGLDFITETRNPSPGQNTESWRIGAFWTYAFDKPPGALAAERPSGLPEAQAGVVRDLRLDELIPGTDLDRIKARLAEARIGGPSELPGLIVYETQVLREIPERQRLVLVHASGKLEKAALIINFEDLRNPTNLIASFERIRRALIDRFGAPTQFFDRGQVTPTLLADIANGTFIRLTEWSRPGGIIRLGIPRRLDGQVRAEIQFAPSFPPPGETFWGLERVR